MKLEPNEGESRENAVSLRCDESVNLSFALRYLNLFNKANSLCSIVDVQLSTEAPLVVKYGVEDFGALKFYLAPKITDEDE